MILGATILQSFHRSIVSRLISTKMFAEKCLQSFYNAFFATFESRTISWETLLYTIANAVTSPPFPPVGLPYFLISTLSQRPDKRKAMWKRDISVSLTMSSLYKRRCTSRHFKCGEQYLIWNQLHHGYMSFVRLGGINWLGYNLSEVTLPEYSPDWEYNGLLQSGCLHNNAEETFYVGTALSFAHFSNLAYSWSP